MPGNYQYINALQAHRYSITSTCNDIIFKVITSHVVASSYMELPEVNLTYDQVDDLLQTHLGLSNESTDRPASATQQLRNYRSTLTGFLAFVGKTSAARVGVELTTRFDESLIGYLDLLDVAPRTKRDRRSHMNRYRDLFDTQRNGAEKARRKTTTLSEALRNAIAKTGIAPKTLARSIGVSTSALQRYLAGAWPNRRGIPGLHRLEAALGLERDTLASLVNDEAGDVTHEAPLDTEYRRRLVIRTADMYYLPAASIGPALEKEWRGLLNYKTAVAPTLERSAKGTWRCVPTSNSSVTSHLASVGSTVCPTAKIVLDSVRGMLGYLSRSVETGGQGIPNESTQTLAWLATPTAINGYLEFLTHRSEGLVHGGQQGFARLVASLVRPQTGYLRQIPRFRHSLPADIRPDTDEAWEHLCDEAYRTARQWIQRAKDMSREPDAPIASLLALEQPLQPVMRAVERINHAAAAAPSGSLSQARHKRDGLLIAFVISNPLRLRSLQSLTWSADNTGSVYRTPEGWRIRLSRSMLKNGDGRAGTKYDVAVAPRVSELIDEYVEEYRGTLLDGSESKYFFVNNRRGRLWKEMSRHVRRLTLRHVAGTRGFSLHAFRHLIATDLLKRHPNAFLTAAVLLNDSLETVMRSYAHLQRDDSFAIHHRYLETLCSSKA